MTISAPEHASILYHGWCCGYGTKSTPKAAKSGSDKVWAVYEHNGKVYTIWGRYAEGSLAGLNHKVHAKGKQQHKWGKVACIDCALGHVAPRRGQVYCDACVPGKFMDQTAQMTCKSFIGEIL